MQLAGKNKHNVAGLYCILPEIDTDKAFSLLNDNQLGFIVPMERNGRKVHGNGAEIGVVRKIFRCVLLFFLIAKISGWLHNQEAPFKKDCFVQKADGILQAAGKGNVVK